MNTTNEVLLVTRGSALQAYQHADANGKGLLANLFGKHHFLTNITERIASFEDCCVEAGEDPADRKFHEGEADEVAYRKLKVIVKAYNEGWVPNWNDDNEAKWYPWFYMNQPGFRLRAIGCIITFSDSTGGSRLCFKSEALAKHAVSMFLDIYKTLYTTSNDQN